VVRVDPLHSFSYSIVKQPDVRRSDVARMSAAICGSSLAESHPGCRCRSSGLRIRTRVIAPCLVRPRARRSFLFLLPRGACGTTGRKAAPAAPAVVDAGIPHAERGTRVEVQPTPKIVELNRASEADRRLRSARAWTLRLAASLTGNCRLRRPRPDRASCRGHALGPSARRVGVNLLSDRGSRL
jgi:hypothetical protein